MAADGIILIDPGVLLNLLASGECEGLLRAVGGRPAVCSALAGHVLRLRPESGEAQPMEDVVTDPLVAAGAIDVCRLEGAEEESYYVDYAGELDDGEAMSLAIVRARGYSLATDELKARRLVGTAAAPERLLSTTDIVRAWADRKKTSRTGLGRLLKRIELRAAFLPSPDDRNYQWWMSATPGREERLIDN